MSHQRSQGCGCLGCFSYFLIPAIAFPLLLAGFTYIVIIAILVWLIYVISSWAERLVKRKREERKKSKGTGVHQTVNANIPTYDMPKKKCSHCGNIECVDYKYCTNCGNPFQETIQMQMRERSRINRMQYLKRLQEEQRKIKREKELTSQGICDAIYRNAELKKQDDEDNLNQYNKLTK